MKILTVVGARPNFMKAAPIMRAIHKHNHSTNEPKIEHLLVHTGQHYDTLMSEQFFLDLGLPRPDVHLGVAPASPTLQTAEILQKFEAVLLSELPDVVILVGDVNSTIACAIATAKTPRVPGRERPILAHVEAGLRSFDRAMPEEINRIVTDQLSDILFVTEKSGIVNLRREGIPLKKIFFVGNTMIDTLLTFQERAQSSSMLGQLGLAGPTQNGSSGSVDPYALLTLHRPSNVDELENFQNILEGLSELSGELLIIFPVHPRTRKNIEKFGLRQHFLENGNGARTGIRLIDPLGYIDFLCLMKNARLVLTDSGGIQEETTCLGIPCVTLRENTERPVTVIRGTNIVAGTSPRTIQEAIANRISSKKKASVPDKWDGKAAERIIRVLIRHTGCRNRLPGTCIASGICAHSSATLV